MSEPDPAATVHQITSGDYRTRCLHVVVGLGAADALYETSRTAADLTAEVRAHSDNLGASC